MGPSTAALALGQWQRGGQQGGSGPYSRFHLSAPNLLRGSRLRLPGREEQQPGCSDDRGTKHIGFLSTWHPSAANIHGASVTAGSQAGCRTLEEGPLWPRPPGLQLQQAIRCTAQKVAARADCCQGGPGRGQAAEADGTTDSPGLSLPSSPHVCAAQRPHTKPLLPLLSGLQLLLCPLATSASPDPGQRDCGRNQVLAERLWERIVWVGQVAITFQPLGSWSLRSTGTNHLPHSLCAPGPGRPQAQCLAMPLLF